MSTTQKVPFFDYSRLFLDNKEVLKAVLEDVGTRGAYIMQSDLVKFEKQLSEYTGTKFAIGVGNATDGLELSWMAIGLEKGDEVIISSHTMLATASAIITAGGIPVPVDIGDDGLIDVDAVQNAIGPRTVAISPTHLNGRTCDMDNLMQLANKSGLAVVEDAAQALGSKFRNKCAGSFGDAASFSFYPAKVLGSIGDGGGVVTNNRVIFEKVFQLHDHGRNTFGEVKSWGRNSRLDNFQAAILNSGFQNYESVVKRRRAIAGIYHSQLKEIDELNLPPAPDEDPDHFDIYQNYELQAINRDHLKLYLTENGVGTLIQWGGKAVHQWESLGFQIKLPKTEAFFRKCLMLPINMFITDEDVYYVCEQIISFYRN
jgi:dTDP-4-amino-4,6-dideoxygalactose transaminase